MVTMQAQTLTWWTFETSPLAEYPGAPALFEQTEEDGIVTTGAGADLPEDVMVRLLHVIDHDFDSATCEANACAGNGSASGGRPHPATVGFSLSGEADEHCDWHPVTVVKIPDGRLVLACADCEPHIAYVEEAPDGRE